MEAENKTMLSEKVSNLSVWSFSKGIEKYPLIHCIVLRIGSGKHNYNKHI